MARWHKITASAMALFLCIACGPERRSSVEDKGAVDRDENLERRIEQRFADKYNVSTIWIKGPLSSRTKASEVKLTFTDKQGNPVEVEALEFKIWMKMHGHGGFDNEQVIERGGEQGNTFIVKNFFFTMKGKWELNLKVKVAGTTYSYEIPVNV